MSESKEAALFFSKIVRPPSKKRNSEADWDAQNMTVVYTTPRRIRVYLPNSEFNFDNEQRALNFINDALVSEIRDKIRSSVKDLASRIERTAHHLANLVPTRMCDSVEQGDNCIILHWYVSPGTTLSVSVMGENTVEFLLGLPDGKQEFKYKDELQSAADFLLAKLVDLYKLKL